MIHLKRFTLIVILLVFSRHPFAMAQNPYFSQYQRSIQGVIANMLPNGAVVASPSLNQPNYYYDWVRDTSLTMKTMIRLNADQNINNLTKKAISRRLETWVDWELARQETPKLTDLGEPRFYVDGRSNREPWGRPQNDGPALRALAAMELAQQWINIGRLDDVQLKLYKAELPARTMIKRDLEYIAHHWTESSFDLWEEERGMHFYTMVAQKVALIKGAKIARYFNDLDAAHFYETQAASIEQYLTAFIDHSKGTIKYAINKEGGLPHKLSDLDVAVLLIAIETFDGKFYVPLNEVIKTVNQLAQSFQKIYPINQIQKMKSGTNLGIAMGRYPDDRYSGFDFSNGNPWFLSTLALAEFACDLQKTGLASLAKNKLMNTAEAQFNRVLFHLNQDGSMSEQFRRDNGYEQGARDLTWSYTSYITAYRACF